MNQRRKEYLRKYMREYRKKPEVKLRETLYNQRPEVKLRKKEYNQRLEVKERNSKRRKKYYIKNYIKNKERILKRNKEYYQIEGHKLSRKKYFKKYFQTPRGKLIQKFCSLRRRLKLKGISHAFTKEEWFFIVEDTKGICPMCNGFVGTNKLTLDHIIPISKIHKGFIYTIEDVRPLCKSCNSKKSNLISEEFGNIHSAMRTN